MYNGKKNELYNRSVLYKVKLFILSFLFTLMLSVFLLASTSYAKNTDPFLSHIVSAAKERIKEKESAQKRIDNMTEKIENDTEEKMFKEMGEEIKQEIASDPGTWAVYIKNMDNGEVFSINPYHRFYAASLIKLYTMACAYEQKRKEAVNKSAANQMEAGTHFYENDLKIRI